MYFAFVVNFFQYRGEAGACFFCYYSNVCCFLFEGVPLSAGTWERLHYFIVALPTLSYNYLEAAIAVQGP